MQLRVARLCLDCHEVHDGRQCPICASESFAYLSRWVPAAERRIQPRLRTSDDVQTYQEIIRPSPKRSLTSKLTIGAISVATITAASWLWQRMTNPSSGPAADPGQGEPPDGSTDPT